MGGEHVNPYLEWSCRLLGSLWDQQAWQSDDIALVAVGGYGRGELHPHSDVDLLLLLGESFDTAESGLEGFLTLLWDIGLDIGHSVRTVAECVENAQADITATRQERRTDRAQRAKAEWAPSRAALMIPPA